MTGKYSRGIRAKLHPAICAPPPIIIEPPITPHALGYFVQMSGTHIYGTNPAVPITADYELYNAVWGHAWELYSTNTSFSYIHDVYIDLARQSKGAPLQTHIYLAMWCNSGYWAVMYEQWQDAITLPTDWGPVTIAGSNYNGTLKFRLYT